jgi:hypothetical protein
MTPSDANNVETATQRNFIPGLAPVAAADEEG